MFIAEIGINHNGNLEIALELIKKACRAGADVVKFQKRNPDICIPQNRKNELRDTPWGRITFLEYKKKIEFGAPEYDQIDRLCRTLNIPWTASVWDIDSLNFLTNSYKVPFIKIASSCANEMSLLTAVAATKLPVVLSTGLSDKPQIRQALKLLKGVDITLMHCVCQYPTRKKDLNLERIVWLKKNWPDLRIGYSSHDASFEAMLTAKKLGATVFEKHITLDRNMWGTDQKASVSIDRLPELITLLK